MSQSVPSISENFSLSVLGGGGFCDNPMCQLRALPAQAAGGYANIGQITNVEFMHEPYVPVYDAYGKSTLKLHYQEFKLGYALMKLEREKVSIEINGVKITGTFCTRCAAVLKMAGGV